MQPHGIGRLQLRTETGPAPIGRTVDEMEPGGETGGLLVSGWLLAENQTVPSQQPVVAGAGRMFHFSCHVTRRPSHCLYAIRLCCTPLQSNRQGSKVYDVSARIARSLARPRARWRTWTYSAA
eukprot:1106618-Pleurochrysis_carterae.AAC.2